MFTSQRIRALRKRLGWSAPKLALYLGVSENAVRRWEMGDRHPRWENAEQLTRLERVAERAEATTK